MILSIYLSEVDNHLTEFKWDIPLGKNETVFLGYRDIPLAYDPLLRDQTPEFDEATGQYLGYNPVDRYRDRQGIYMGFSAEQQSLSAKVTISALKEHGVNANRYLTNEIYILKNVLGYNCELYSLSQQIQQWFNTQVADLTVDKFFRLTIKKRLPMKNGFLVPGAQLRYQNDQEINNTGLYFSLQYELMNLMKIEAGIRHNLSGENVGGRYCFGFNYQAPSGLALLYRYTFIPPDAKHFVPADGKKHYDPDYTLLKQDNIMQVSVGIDF